jgi:hypothetical protein
MRDRLLAQGLVVVVLFGPLSLLAETLMVRTHHRPLGAATFATVLVLMWAAVDMLASRQLDPHRGAIQVKMRKFTWVSGGLFSVIVLCRGFL